MVSILFKWLMVVGLLPAFAPVADHPFYISVTEIEYNAPEKNLEVSCKIFTDDLEKVLREKYKTKVDLLNPPDRTAMDKLIKDYVQQHLAVSVDGKPVNFQYIGFEQKDEAIYSYYEAKVNAVKKVDISNDLLFEYKKEQINILHVTVNGERKSTRLNNPDSKVSFQF